MMLQIQVCSKTPGVMMSVSQVLASANYLVWGLDEREVWVIWHNRFREGCETHSLFAKLMDLPHDSFQPSHLGYKGRDLLEPRQLGRLSLANLLQ